jgi:hypothetical protein
MTKMHMAPPTERPPEVSGWQRFIQVVILLAAGVALAVAVAAAVIMFL